MAPERLESSEFLKVMQLTRPNLLTLDEAHCFEENTRLATDIGKVKISDNDALFFTITKKPLPPKHPLSSNKTGQAELFELFGENRIYPENN